MNKPYEDMYNHLYSRIMEIHKTLNTMHQKVSETMQKPFNGIYYLHAGSVGFYQSLYIMIRDIEKTIQELEKMYKTHSEESVKPSS